MDFKSNFVLNFGPTRKLEKLEPSLHVRILFCDFFQMGKGIWARRIPCWQNALAKSAKQRVWSRVLRTASSPWYVVGGSTHNIACKNHCKCPMRNHYLLFEDIATKNETIVNDRIQHKSSTAAVAEGVGHLDHV